MGGVPVECGIGVLKQTLIVALLVAMEIVKVIEERGESVTMFTVITEYWLVMHSEGCYQQNYIIETKMLQPIHWVNNFTLPNQYSVIHVLLDV